MLVIINSRIFLFLFIFTNCSATKLVNYSFTHLNICVKDLYIWNVFRDFRHFFLFPLAFLYNTQKKAINSCRPFSASIIIKHFYKTLHLQPFFHIVPNAFAQKKSSRTRPAGASSDNSGPWETRTQLKREGTAEWLQGYGHYIFGQKHACSFGITENYS